MMLPNETVRAPMMAPTDAEFIQVSGDGTAVQEAVTAVDGTAVLVEVRASDEASVYGWVWVDPDGAEDGQRLGLVSLNCDRHPDGGCEHIREASETIESSLNQAPTGTEWAVTHRNVEQQVADSAMAAARRAAADTFPDPGTTAATLLVADRHMTEAVQRARERFAARERRPISYMTRNATGGLGDPSGGRAFGVELEFVLPDRVDQRTALTDIGRELYAAGITSTRAQLGYHSAAQQGYRVGQWSYERDATVAAELVSPIMHDTEETWEQLREVCRIVREHDGRPGPGAGCHVTVGCADYDLDLDNHENLVNAIRAYEDVLYRVGQNTWRRHHRRSGWAGSQPELPVGGFTSLPDVRQRHSRYFNVNLGHMRNDPSDRAEFRLWDSTVRPEEIQAQINVSLGLAEAATYQRDWGPHTPVGTNWRAGNDPNSLSRADAARFGAYGMDQQVRDLGARLFEHHPEQREQLAALYAMTTWERPDRRRRRVPYSQH